MIKIQKKIIRIDDKIFFIKTNNMKKRNFIRLFNVKNKSYLYKLYARLYDYIIGDGINLYKEYKKYYILEYTSFTQFLLDHYNISEELIGYFNNKYSYYKYIDIGNEQPLYNLLHDSKLKSIISKFMGGYEYEN